MTRRVNACLSDGLEQAAGRAGLELVDVKPGSQLHVVELGGDQSRIVGLSALVEQEQKRGLTQQ